MAVNALNYSYEEDELTQQTQNISDSITQNWTEQALECYKLNCNCSECSVSKGNYSFVCQMPRILEILIKNIGKPAQVNLERIK